MYVEEYEIENVKSSYQKEFAHLILELRAKADALGLDWEKDKHNLFLDYTYYICDQIMTNTSPEEDRDVFNRLKDLTE